MTGDAPQPGETARDDGTPWARPDPASPWWQAEEPNPADRTRSIRRQAAQLAAGMPTLDPPKPAEHTGEAAEAHRAGAEDLLAALTGEPVPPAEPAFTVPDHPPVTTAETGPAEPKHAQPEPEGRAVEHDHDRVDAERFNTEGDGTVYAARNRTLPVAEPEREATITDLLNTIPVEPPRAGTGPDVPDVMVLPDPERNRPTVALERNSVPGQPASGLSRLGRAREDRDRADRALQDRVRQERAAALLETSPFWKAEEERRAGSWPPPETREKLATAGRPPRRRARPPRRPFSGLLGMLLLALLAAFFAWVGAEPFWLAAGHGDRGTATVERCTGAGVTQRCTGRFVAADGTYQVAPLALFGVEPGQRAQGATAEARMVRSDSRQAYVGSTGLLMNLRWALSFVLVLLCGLGIAGLTGARRLDSARARRGATVFSMVGPLALLGGFLYLAY